MAMSFTFIQLQNGEIEHMPHTDKERHEHFCTKSGRRPGNTLGASTEPRDYGSISRNAPAIFREVKCLIKNFATFPSYADYA